MIICMSIPPLPSPWTTPPSCSPTPAWISSSPSSLGPWTQTATCLSGSVQSTPKNASELEENTTIWMMWVKTCIIILSSRCWVIGHLVTILRRRLLDGPGSFWQRSTRLLQKDYMSRTLEEIKLKVEYHCTSNLILRLLLVFYSLPKEFGMGFFWNGKVYFKKGDCIVSIFVPVINQFYLRTWHSQRKAILLCSTHFWNPSINNASMNSINPF